MTTEIKEREPPKLFIEFLGSLLAGFAVWGIASSLSSRSFSTGDFVDPEAVADIAAALPQDEDSFILSTWKYVTDNIQYQGYSSNLHFVNDIIKCSGCRVPEATLKAGRGNCVSMSSVLASILRNRLPPERVFMAVGEMRLDGVGGHAWCQVQRRNGRWYLLESTSPPKGWVPVDTVSYIYEPFALYNDRLFYCYSEELCQIKVKSCHCREILLDYLYS